MSRKWWMRANREDPDQMLHYALADLGLHFLLKHVQILRVNMEVLCDLQTLSFSILQDIEDLT